MPIVWDGHRSLITIIIATATDDALLLGGRTMDRVFGLKKKGFDEGERIQIGYCYSEIIYTHTHHISRKRKHTCTECYGTQKKRE
jgi:hypothetical protein